MANDEHLKILQQGVAVWNRWRQEHPEEEIDLRGADLVKENLRQTNLSKVNLAQANLSGAILSGSYLAEANLTETNLSNTRLVEADLSKANLTRANLTETVCKWAIFTQANLFKANLSSADLLGAYLARADLSSATLTGADLTKAILFEVKLNRANLDKVNLTGVFLYGTARDDWSINDITCRYIYWDYAGTERTPKSRDFRPGEFEELYRQLPTFEYYFEHGFTPIDAVIIDRVVQAINARHPEFELRLDSFHSRGQPHAVFTVLHQKHVNKVKKQISADFEQRLAVLEGKQEQLMDLYQILAAKPQIIEHILGDKHVIQAGRDYLEHVDGDAYTGGAEQKRLSE